MSQNNLDTDRPAIEIAPHAFVECNISRATRHEEVHISENDWEKIHRKINQIEIKKQIDVFQLLFGGFITCTLDMLYSLYNKMPSYEKFFISLIILVFYYGIERICRKRTYDISVHQTHLQDIKCWVNEIEKMRSKK